VVKVDAWTDSANDIGMPIRLLRIDALHKSSLPILAWRHSEKPAKGARKNLMTLKPARQCYIQNSVFGDQEQHCRALDSESQRHLFRCFACGCGKEAMEVKC